MQSSCAHDRDRRADPLRALGCSRAVAPRARLPGGRASPARPARPRPRTSSRRCCALVRARTRASENLNTEIGLPLTILEAPRGTEALVLEMAMRGEGQIAELAAIAEPDVGVIVNVGPVHLELLGTVERVAAAKAELIRDLRPGAACVVPASEPLLERPPARRPRHLDLRPRRPGAASVDGRAGVRRSRRAASGSSSTCPTREPHNLLNTLAAVAAARALGVRRGRRRGRAASPRCAARSWSCRAASWS